MLKRLIMITCLLAICGSAASAESEDVVQTRCGTLQGVDGDGGVEVFEGVPYATPPVGDLRWREPQPLARWSGVRKADRFGDRPMQPSLFADMRFRSSGMSEDCLYLNVWKPPLDLDAPQLPAPVLVYFHGGGFAAGDGSEFRYDGTSMARRGIVVVTVNYRLSVFGFLAYPELTAESPHHASGNYGLLDQSAALHWVHDNIRAFGGDPARVTIAGQSAGSFSVCAQMASPLSRDLIAGVIGQSGGLGRADNAPLLADGERAGVRFAEAVGAHSLAELRAMPAEVLLDAVRHIKGHVAGVPLITDGYFLPEPLAAIYANGEQARVPLLVGWTVNETGYRPIIKHGPPTVASYEAGVRRLFSKNADELLKLYSASTDDQVPDVAGALAGDLYIAHGTWKWADLATRTGGQPVYRYVYEHARPPAKPEEQETADAVAADAGPQDEKEDPAHRSHGARHANDIEYVMGTLATNSVYAWTEDDRRMSEIMQTYFANFIKTGDPNGGGLPSWPANRAGAAVQEMRLEVTPHVAPETTRARYELLDRIPASRPSR